VLASSPVIQPCYRVTLSDGTALIASADHRWLVGNNNGMAEWRETQHLKPRHPTSRSPRDAPSRLLRVVDVWDAPSSYAQGYMAGILDGEGYLNQRLRTDRGYGHTFRVTFAQRQNQVAAQMCQYLSDNGFEYSVSGPSGTNGDVYTFNVTGRHTELLRLLGSTQPRRLLAKLDFDKMGRMTPTGAPTVETLEFLGEQEVVAVTTSTGTFIAEGLATHNCAPSGFHDDGVMALGLALYGWDRVQGSPPETVHPLLVRGDDPHIADYLDSENRKPMTVGDFADQLPLTGW
jgi:hypothetical protein